MRRVECFGDFAAKRWALATVSLNATPLDLAPLLVATTRSPILANDDGVNSALASPADMTHIHNELDRRAAHPVCCKRHKLADRARDSPATG